MNKRPQSVTVISWILIVMGTFSLVNNVLNMNNPTVKQFMEKSLIPVNVQFAVIYIGALVTIVSGLAMLKRQNWARFLYVAWSIIGLIAGIATSPMKIVLIPGFIILMIIIFFLFRPKANKYFKVIRDPSDS